MTHSVNSWSVARNHDAHASIHDTKCQFIQFRFIGEVLFLIVGRGHALAGAGIIVFAEHSHKNGTCYRRKGHALSLQNKYELFDKSEFNREGKGFFNLRQESCYRFLLFAELSVILSLLRGC